MVHKWFPQKSRKQILSEKHSMTVKINPGEKPFCLHFRSLLCHSYSNKTSMSLLRSERNIGRKVCRKTTAPEIHYREFFYEFYEIF